MIDCSGPETINSFKDNILAELDMVEDTHPTVKGWGRC